MQVDFSMILESSECNGHFEINVINENNLVRLNIDDIIHFNCKLNLPSKLIIDISGKNYNTDTLIDPNGNILKDKFCKLKSMTLGNIPIKESLIFNLCRYKHDHSETEVFDTYWGFNGIVTINFDEENFIKWHLKHNNQIL